MDKERVLQDHLNLIYQLVNKYSNKIQDLDKEDVEQEVLTHVSHKLRFYKKDRAKLSTYIYRVSENKLKNMVRSSKNNKEEVVDYTEGFGNELWGAIDYAPSEKVLIEVAFDVLGNHPYKEVLLRIVNGESQTSISKDIGCSRQRISKIWNEYIEEVKEEL